MAKRGPKPKGETGHPYYTLAPGNQAVSLEQRDFMRRRIGGLLNYADLTTRPMIDLLANAYLFGLEDATEHLTIKRPEPPLTPEQWRRGP